MQIAAIAEKDLRTFNEAQEFYMKTQTNIGNRNNQNNISCNNNNFNRNSQLNGNFENNTNFNWNNNSR